MTLANIDYIHADEADRNISEHFSKAIIEQAAVKNKIIYEQPLNERMRNWLRLEYLFQCVSHRINGLSSWDSRIALEGIIKILDFISRNDFKPDLIKDIEYHIQSLQRWQKFPQVDTVRLQKLMNELLHIKESLVQIEGQFAGVLSKHHLLSSVRQRNIIPGGSCQFDLPAYYYWSQKSAKDRQHNLQSWLNAFEPLQKANELNLYLIRQNAHTSHQIANGGFFQSKLDAQKSYQIIRIIVPEDFPCYPEISGGKHRFNLRFFEHQQLEGKPIQSQKKLHFDLCCCSFI
ncbi:MAG: cell division protein ZapD [Pseudomonadota bacterium]